MKHHDHILVVGLNRSGTKWLSNSLANHPDIFAVTAEQHFGILESNIFNDISRVLPTLSREDDYTAFVCLWAESDFVKTTGVTRDDMLNWEPRPKTPYEAFERLMNEETCKNSKSVWLQKCSPIQALQASDKLKGTAKVVAIRRPFDRVLESSIALHEQSGANSSFFRNVIVVAIQNRLIDYFWNMEDCHCVHFDEMKSDRDATMRTVCDYLKLPFDSQMTEPRFQQNTSFRNQDRRPLSLAQRSFCQFVQLCLKMVPVSWVARFWQRSRSRNPLNMVSGTYRNFDKENVPNEVC